MRRIAGKPRLGHGAPGLAAVFGHRLAQAAVFTMIAHQSQNGAARKLDRIGLVEHEWLVILAVRIRNFGAEAFPSSRRIARLPSRDHAVRSALPANRLAHCGTSELQKRTVLHERRPMRGVADLRHLFRLRPGLAVVSGTKTEITKRRAADF